MQVESKFYERLHSNDTAYGRNVYDVPRLTSAPAFLRCLQRNDKSRLRLLDIGCGKGQFLLDVTGILRQRHLVLFDKFINSAGLGRYIRVYFHIFNDKKDKDSGEKQKRNRQCAYNNH